MIVVLVIVLVTPVERSAVSTDACAAAVWIRTMFFGRAFTPSLGSIVQGIPHSKHSNTRF